MAILRINALNKYDKSIEELLEGLDNKENDALVCNTKYFDLIFVGLTQEDKEILKADIKEAIRAYKYMQEHGTYNGYVPEYFNPWWKEKPNDNS